MSKSPRKQRLAQNLRDFLAQMIDQELKDPRVHGAGFVGVNHVELNRDASVGRVYVSFYGAGPEKRAAPGPQAAAAIDGLQAAAGFLRGQVGRHFGLRRAPELRFIHDVGPDMQERISDILREDAERGSPGSGGEGQGE